MRRPRLSSASLAAAIAALWAWPQARAATDPPDHEQVVLRDAERIEASLVQLVQRVRASTVAVVRYVRSEENGRVFEHSGGLGSGVAVSQDGKVFTNVHVVKDASHVEVVLPGGKRVRADLFNQMPAYDFALLRVKSRSLEPAPFADTDDVHPGQWALAAGNPHGLALDGEPIVSLGIVSGKGRVTGGRFRYHNAVQTDAEINPGNSGGPLFDLRGRVIGINGLISTRDASRTNQGVAFAIAADQIRAFLPALLTGRRVTKGYHGIVLERRQEDGRGLAVRSVRKGSPADKVGIRAGDRIVAVDGEKVDDLADWARVEAMLPPGKTVTFRVWRRGRILSKRLELEWRDTGEKKR